VFTNIDCKLTVPSIQGISCEKSMRTSVVITALTLRREDRRNVSGFASELEYFAAETHSVVVPCVIFSSHLSVYHLVRSFAVLLFVLSSRGSHVFPYALHCSISLRSAEVLTDELDQASKINSGLSENSNFFERWRNKSVAQETPASLRKNNCGKYNTEAYVITTNLIAHRQTMPQWWLVRMSRK